MSEDHNAAAPPNPPHPKWPHDDTASKMAFYGDFRQGGWSATHLIHIHLPYKMYYEKRELTAGIMVHKLIAGAVLAAAREIWEKCSHDQAAVDKTGASDWGGCFNIRRISGSSSWSNHSWACALDLSPSTNGFRHDSSTTLSNIVIDAFKRQGAFWGGDYHGRKDPMHFEFVSR